jgi:hypothetical protein
MKTRHTGGHSPLAALKSRPGEGDGGRDTNLRLLINGGQQKGAAAKAELLLPPLRRACMAELLGTMVLILVGLGSVAQSGLSKGANGGYLSINLGFSIGVTLGIYASGATL